LESIAEGKSRKLEIREVLRRAFRPKQVEDIMRIVIRRIGNSKGIIIPNAMLAQLGLDQDAEVSVENGAIVIRAPARPVREGWAEACKELADAGEDALLTPEFPNEGDAELEW
jgi:antitoxin MazE